MVKVDEEKKNPGPDWNRRLKRLLMLEIIVALVGLALFYGYLVSRPLVTLTGLAIATAPQPLEPAVEEGFSDRQPPPLSEECVPEAEKMIPAAPAPVEEVPVAPAAAGSGVEPTAPALVPSPPLSPEEIPEPNLETRPAAPAPESILIEVGEFILPGRLEAAVVRLKQMGIPATVVERELPTPMYRVYLGPFTEGEKALAMRAVSRRLGDQPFLEKRPEGYFLIISSFYLEANVEIWLQKYRQAGYEPRVMRELLPVKHSFLLVDAAATGSPVEIILERLRQAGFSKARQQGSLPAPSKN